MTDTTILGKVQDFIPDQHNANKGTERGNYMLSKSLQDFGAGRSILVDKNNRIIAGNKTWHKFGESGLEDVLIVPTDGKTLVAVQRVDIDLNSPEGRELALADNRVGEVNLAWDIPTLQETHDEVNLSAWFTETEIQDWQFAGEGGEWGDGDDEPLDYGGGVDGDKFPLPIVLSWKEKQRWDAIKARIGIKVDRAAFLEMCDRIEDLL